MRRARIWTRGELHCECASSARSPWIAFVAFPNLLRTVSLLSLLSALALWHGTSSAQGTVYGVTWVPPEDDSRAISELADIWSSGVRAVRMPARDANSFLLDSADSLGIELFVELSPGYLPAGRLLDTLSAAQAELYSLAERVRGHRSVTRVGLGRWANSRDATACVYFNELAKRWSSDRDGASTYYTTTFLRDDRCNSSVDEVYVELPDHPPQSLDSLYRSAAARIGNLNGIASLGTWIEPSGYYRGVRNERSPEWQARYLETALGSFANSSEPAPAYVFIHRWSDPETVDDFFGDIRLRRYGIHARPPRPAAEVLTGYATGQQLVFALEPGQPSGVRGRWSTILAWVIIGVLASIYAWSPQMRHMVPRYFLSHGFYREAIASGRESLLLETVVVLAAVSIGVGLALTTLAREISLLPSFVAVRNWIEPERRDFLGALMVQRWSLMILLASAFAVVYLAWASLLSLLSRRARTVFPSQTLVVAVWPLWPLLGLLLVSPALAPALVESRVVLAAMTVAVTVALIVYAAVRSLLDYRSVAGASLGEVMVGLLMHPLTWASFTAGFLLTGRYAPEVGYFWALLTRT